MEQALYKISVAGPNAAETNRQAASLMTTLRDASEDIKVDREKASHDTMDLGAIVTALFPSAALIAFAKGAGDWLRRHQGAKITIKDGKGVVVAENITSGDAVRLLEILRGR